MVIDFFIKYLILYCDLFFLKFSLFTFEPCNDEFSWFNIEKILIIYEIIQTDVNLQKIASINYFI